MIICICQLCNTDFDHRGCIVLILKMDCHCEDASLQYSQYTVWAEQEMDLKHLLFLEGGMLVEYWTRMVTERL